MKFTTSSLTAYRAAVAALPFGKKIGVHHYIHTDGIPDLPDELTGIVTLAAELAETIPFEYTVLKLGVRSPSVSLLDYPLFNRQAFPVLARSAKLSLEDQSLKMMDFKNSKNPPILHRKELLLPLGHKDIPKFSSLTVQAESFGLFQNSSQIGLLRGWKALLKSKGIKVVGHRLISKAEEDPLPNQRLLKVERHKTAIHRHHLSSPFQLLEKYGYLDGRYTFFDYGCGKGEDIELLNERNISAEGWDPYFLPNAQRVSADIVNLGFVINVIEDRKERDKAVKKSFKLANKFLIVSAMKDAPGRSENTTGFRDGGLTRIGTFQKYFSLDELQNYARSVLGASVVPVSQESVICFKNEEEANRFFAKRAGLRRSIVRGSKRRAEELFLLDGNAREIMGAFWDRCIQLGREPLSDELPENADIGQFGLSPPKAFGFLCQKFKTDELDASAEQRRQDLLVEFALGLFEKRSFYKYLSSDVQRDIDCFFSNYSTLRNSAQELLFSIADEEKLLAACQEATSNDLGYLFGDHSLQLHVDLVDRLPPILRVYIGCAERMLGGRGSTELIKVHIQSGKVSFMSYDDFEYKFIPSVLERIKVNLWKRHIDYFDYIGPFTPQPLLMKSLFLNDESDLFKKQEPFDRKILKLGVFDFENPHPSLKELKDSLSELGLDLRNGDLVAK